MPIQYENLGDNNNNRRKSYNLYDGESHIGMAEWNLGVNNELIIAINIFPDYQYQGLGYEVFNKLIAEAGSINQVEIIKEVWCKSPEYDHCEDGMSSNLKVFLENIQKLSAVDSIFSTPTGKWAKKLGFTKAQIISVNDEEVVVNFTR